MNEEQSTASEGGSAGETGAMQDAGQGSQESRQDQSSESSQVEGGESQASSRTAQARSNSTAAERRMSSREIRLIENAIEKRLSSALDSKLTPLLERLQPPQPSANSGTQGNELDYNDLQGSIQKIVTRIIQEQLKDSFGKTIPQLKQEILGEFTTKTTQQEARKYLTSQKDIGNDPSRHEEIQDIIANDKILYFAVAEHPLEVMQEAIRRWRSTKTNPNAPSKDELGTVAGGMGTVQRRNGEPSREKIRELQQKVIAANLPRDERDKLNSEIDTLMAALK